MKQHVGQGAPPLQASPCTCTCNPQDEGYEEYRSLARSLLDTNPETPQAELTKRIQQVADPIISRLADATTKLIQ